MEIALDINDFQHVLQDKLSDVTEDDVLELNDVKIFIGNEKKQMEIMRNKLKEKKFSINRIHHEIEASTVLMTEFKESVIEEERKLDDYPIQMGAMKNDIDLFSKEFTSAMNEYETVKVQMRHVEGEWSKKLETIIDGFGFDIIMQSDQILIQFSKLQEDMSKKYSASIVINNGIYEAGNTSPRITHFEDYVDDLNKGVSFSTFCCLLRKSFN